MPRRLQRPPIPDGTAIERHYRGRIIRGSIFSDSDGRVGIEIERVKYPSLTAAAKAVTGYPKINGWRFWNLDK